MPDRPNAAIPLAQQLLRLTALGLTGAAGAVVNHGARLRFDFIAQPTPLGREYACQIQLPRDGREPVAYVLKPDVQELAEGKRPPHIYEYENGRTELCLHRPKERSWHRGYWLSQTIVPWTFEWLRYYEIWLATGEWEGGGDHPNAPRRRFGMAGRHK